MIHGQPPGVPSGWLCTGTTGDGGGGPGSPLAAGSAGAGGRLVQAVAKTTAAASTTPRQINVTPIISSSDSQSPGPRVRVGSSEV